MTPSTRRIFALVGLAVAVGGCATPSLERASWQRVTTVHFEIFSALDDEDTWALASELETFRSAVSYAVGREQTIPKSRIRVYAFQDGRLLQRYSRRTVQSYVATSLTGPSVVLGRGGGLDDRSTLALRRDLANLLLESTGASRRPLWFDRGVAQVLSTTTVVPDEGVVIGTPRRDLLSRTSGLSAATLRELFETADLVDHGEQDRLDFDAGSWLLMHYVMLGSSKRESAQLWLRRVLRANLTAADELIAGLGGERELVRQLIAYRERARFASQGFRVQAAPEGIIRSTKLLSPAAAASQLARLSLDLGWASSARRGFARAMEQESDDAMALAGWLAARAAEGSFEDLEERIGDVSGDPGAGAEAHLLLAEAQLSAGLASEDAEARARLAVGVREAALRARALDSLRSGPAALVAASYLIEGEDAGEGLRAAAAAERLMPSSAEVQLLRARLLERERRVAVARGVASAVVSRSQETRLRREARDLIERLGVTRLQ